MIMSVQFMHSNFAQAECNVNAYAKYISQTMDSMSSLGQNLRTARKAAKLTQTQLAKRAGVSCTTVSDIERGRNQSSKDLYELAQALKVSVEWLMTGEDAPIAGHESAIEAFAWTYRNASDLGRRFLDRAVETAKDAFVEQHKKGKKLA